MNATYCVVCLINERAEPARSVMHGWSLCARHTKAALPLAKEYEFIQIVAKRANADGVERITDSEMVGQ